MTNRQKIFIAMLASLTFAVGAFSFGYAMADGDSSVTIPTSAGGGSSAKGLDAIDEALSEILSTSVDPPPEKALVRGAIKGMVNVVKKAGDDYAAFYSPQSYVSLQELTTGQFSGIGVWLKEKGKVLEIVSVLPSTPALEAGLKRGDVIRTVDGQDVSKLASDDVINRVKGPEGTEVDLGIERDGAMLDFSITRRAIELPNLKAGIVDGDIGYVRLFGFGDGAGDQLRKKVRELVDRGARGVILDLRDNGGGLFDEGVSVASAFIEDGPVVGYRTPGEDDVIYEAEGKAFPDIPVVVLVNEGSASASEIVAGALQDRDRALLVGTTTYGKGSVQQILPLAYGSAIKVTSAAYLTPGGTNINGKGIKPDVVSEGSPASQKQRAIEILTGILLSGSSSGG
ncbi:MAG: PDZ domain-containing protein [Actinobacteria bacterium]|nr:PDZ domain-containing protein [Actinomycetota bacterium]